MYMKFIPRIAVILTILVMAAFRISSPLQLLVKRRKKRTGIPDSEVVSISSSILLSLDPWRRAELEILAEDGQVIIDEDLNENTRIYPPENGAV